MRKGRAIISILCVMSIFFISGCGIGLLSLEKDNKQQPIQPAFVGKDMEGGVDGKVDKKRPPLPPVEKRSLALENTVINFVTPQTELLPVSQDVPEELEKYLLKQNSCYGSKNDVYFLVIGYSYNVEKIEQESRRPFQINLEKGLKSAVEGIDRNILKRLHIKSINDKALWKRNGKELTGICDLDIGGGAIINCNIDGVAFSQGREMWCVIVFYKIFDDDAERMKNLIINSIEIK